MGLFRRTFDSNPEVEAPENSSSPIATPAPIAAPAQAPAATPPEVELQELRETVSEIHRVLSEVADRGSAQERVFDTLHSELQDYKNDFIYEHLKPVLWPLLFLFDSLEQYAREIVGRVSATGTQQVEAKEVLDHLKFFRGQLVESLRICEVTPMKQPSGPLDPKCHKGIGTEIVQDPEEENTVRRVVRTGWFLNGKVLRHAEVIVGKLAENGRATARPVVPARVDPAASAIRASSDASASGGGRGG
jgi:molecular chaperone GrpE (heat shock protein)